MATYTEEIVLTDKVTPAAQTAQQSLSNVGQSLTQTQSQMGQGLAGKAGPGGGLSSVFADASHAAEIGKQSITAAIGSIKGAFTSLASGDVKGAVTGLFDALANMSKMLDLIAPGLGQAVSAVISIAGGLVGVTAGLIQSGAEFAIESTQAKEQMLSMFDAMGAGVTTGKELDDMLSDLSDRVGISKDQLAGYTTAFLKMGVTGKDQLEQLTTAAISANAIVGAGGAEAFQNLQKKIIAAGESGGKLKLNSKMIQQITQAGASLDDVAAALGTTRDKLSGTSVDATKFGQAITDSVTKRGGPALEKLGNTIASIKGKFMSNIGDMFEDMAPAVDAFMKQVRDLFDIFGQAKPSGQAMKAGITGFFSETLTLAGKLVPLVKNFLLDLIIWGLKAYIALRPTVLAIQDWLKSAEGIAAQNLLWEVLKDALIAVATILGVVIGLFAIMATATVAVGLAIWGLIGAIISLTVDSFAALANFATMAVTAGEQFIQGLVDGITGGAKTVTDAVSSVAGSAVDAFKSALGIASPSKVGIELGGHFGSGLGIGIGQAANDVHATTSDLATGVVDAAAPQAAQPPAAASGGAANVFYISINGAGKNEKEIAEEVVAQVMESMRLAAGA